MAAGEEFGKSEVLVTHSTLHVAGFIPCYSRRHRHVLCEVVTGWNIQTWQNVTQYCQEMNNNNHLCWRYRMHHYRKYKRIAKTMAIISLLALLVLAQWHTWSSADSIPLVVIFLLMQRKLLSMLLYPRESVTATLVSLKFHSVCWIYLKNRITRVVLVSDRVYHL